MSDLWCDDKVKIISSNDKERIEFVGQKPEKLIQRTLESSTQPGDIVLDFHLGSGTTATVAHKMKRQYIGIEQIIIIGNKDEYLKLPFFGQAKDIDKADGN